MKERKVIMGTVYTFFKRLMLQIYPGSADQIQA